jgi:hypothetical protein
MNAQRFTKLEILHEGFKQAWLCKAALFKATIKVFSVAILLLGLCVIPVTYLILPIILFNTHSDMAGLAAFPLSVLLCGSLSIITALSFLRNSFLKHFLYKSQSELAFWKKNLRVDYEYFWPLFFAKLCLSIGVALVVTACVVIFESYVVINWFPIILSVLVILLFFILLFLLIPFRLFSCFLIDQKVPIIASLRLSREITKGYRMKILQYVFMFYLLFTSFVCGESLLLYKILISFHNVSSYGVIILVSLGVTFGLVLMILLSFLYACLSACDAYIYTVLLNKKSEELS